MGGPDAARGKDIGIALAQRVERVDNRALFVTDDPHLHQINAKCGKILGDISYVFVFGAPG